jgi:hypothetical protein
MDPKKNYIGIMANNYHTELFEFLFELVSEHFNIVLYNTEDEYNNISLLRKKYVFIHKTAEELIDDYKNDICVQYLVLGYMTETLRILKGEHRNIIFIVHTKDELEIAKYDKNLKYFVVSDILEGRVILPLNKSTLLPILNQTILDSEIIHIVKIGWVINDIHGVYDKILSNKNVRMTFFCKAPSYLLEDLCSRYNNIHFEFNKSTYEMLNYIVHNKIKFILHVPNDENDDIYWTGSIAMALDNSMILISSDKVLSKFNIPKEFSLSYDDKNFNNILLRNHYRDIRDKNVLQLYKNKCYENNYKTLYSLLDQKYDIIIKNKHVMLNSHSYQDLFVLIANNVIENGYFVEIGSAWPKFLNNTYILETELNWKGIMIEYNNQDLDSYKKMRPNSIHVINDATKIDYLKLLKDNNAPLNINYLQIDLDVENESTLNTLRLFDKYVFDTYKFATITFEHDIYRGDYFDTRFISRQILHKRGYVLLFPDVSVGIGQEHNAYEDWWVHPDLVDKEFIKFFYNKNIKPNLTQFLL